MSSRPLAVETLLAFFLFLIFFFLFFFFFPVVHFPDSLGEAGIGMFEGGGYWSDTGGFRNAVAGRAQPRNSQRNLARSNNQQSTPSPPSMALKETQGGSE